jgi:protocatechuate 3,4-dioxygenase beta subunit
MHRFLLTRRMFLAGTLALPAAVLARGAARADSWPGALAETPECGDDDEPTPRQTAGPFYTPDSPLKRHFIEKGMSGDRVTLVGYVLDTDCKPIPNAMVDLWHADADGEYDNEGYRCRGHQFTDARGRFWFETLAPGLYPGRTRHYHVRVQPAHGKILTTQLYFPDEPRNPRDGLFMPELLLELGKSAVGRHARFDFVVKRG